ncbi:MAG: hypothetical protein WCP29_04600 [Acidobacteriota bacterium]
MQPDVRRDRCRQILPVLALVALVALEGVWPAPALAQTLERDLFVTVLDRTGTPVPDLGPGAFAIREDGRLREVLRVKPATEPIDLAVLIDTSAAATSQISDLRLGLNAFITKMRGPARLALIEFGERPHAITDYTADAVLLAQGVGRIFARPGSGAYALDGIIETLNGFKKRDAERAAIVVVWLGGPEFSNRDDRSVLTLLGEQSVALHVLTVSRGAAPDVMTVDGRSRESVFGRGPDISGGSRQNILSSMAITDSLGRIAAELLAQYRVTYARPQTLIPPEKIEVRATGNDLTARGTPPRAKATPPK